MLLSDHAPLYRKVLYYSLVKRVSRCHSYLVLWLLANSISVYKTTWEMWEGSAKQNTNMNFSGIFLVSLVTACSLTWAKLNAGTKQLKNSFPFPISSQTGKDFQFLLGNGQLGRSTPLSHSISEVLESISESYRRKCYSVSELYCTQKMFSNTLMEL